MTLALIVQGGARSIDPTKVDANKAGVLSALEAGWAVLEGGGSAVDAVEATLRILEDNPLFNAGCGAALNAAGEVELDAAIVEGDALRAGAVAAVTGVPHPISIARLLMDEPTVFLVSHGALRFAAENAAEHCNPYALITDERREEWEERHHRRHPSRSLEEEDRVAAAIAANTEEGHSALLEQTEHDTVGCLALDAKGLLAAGTSTGGKAETPPGRIGDAPLVGCGLYADNELGACTLSGHGEAIIRLVLAKMGVDLLKNAEPDAVAEEIMGLMDRRIPGDLGCVLLDPSGRVGWAHNTEHFPCAYRTSDMDSPKVFAAKE